MKALDAPLVPEVFPLELTQGEHDALAAASAAQSPLPPDAKKKFRLSHRRFGLVAIKYAYRWHYSQNRPGWGYHLAPSAECWADCSFGISRVFYSAGQWSSHPIADPLGMHYSGYGNTESMYAWLRSHHAPRGKYRIGDIALFLQGASEHHHTISCIAEGDEHTSVWWSNGQEADPRSIGLLYRSDLTGVFRHPSLA